MLCIVFMIWPLHFFRWWSLKQAMWNFLLLFNISMVLHEVQFCVSRKFSDSPFKNPIPGSSLFMFCYTSALIVLIAKLSTFWRTDDCLVSVFLGPSRPGALNSLLREYINFFNLSFLHCINFNYMTNIKIV